MNKIIMCGATITVSDAILFAFIEAVDQVPGMLVVCENGVWQARETSELFAGLVESLD